MKTLILLLSFLLVGFTIKAQYTTPIIDSVIIDVSYGVHDTIITYFPTEQLGGSFSIVLDASDLSADYSWGVIVSSIRGKWAFLPNPTPFPVTTTPNNYLVGILGSELMLPFVGIWVDRKTNTSGEIIAKRIMSWDIRYLMPF